MTEWREGIDGRPHLEPLAVSPRQACALLGIGNTRLYQLIGAGELETYNEGRARRITMHSIRARVARLTRLTGNKPQAPLLGVANSRVFRRSRRQRARAAQERTHKG
jgi:excisionase family DNA binding protein